MKAGHPTGLAGDIVLMSVADTGLRMAPEDLAKTFEPLSPPRKSARAPASVWPRSTVLPGQPGRCPDRHRAGAWYDGAPPSLPGRCRSGGHGGDGGRGAEGTGRGRCGPAAQRGHDAGKPERDRPGARGAAPVPRLADRAGDRVQRGHRAGLRPARGVPKPYRVEALVSVLDAVLAERRTERERSDRRQARAARRPERALRS